MKFIVTAIVVLVLVLVGCGLAEVYKADHRSWGRVPDDARPWDAESCEGIATDLAVLVQAKGWGARRALVFDSIASMAKRGGDDDQEWVGELVRAWDTDESPPDFYRRCMKRLKAHQGSM